MDDTRRVEPAHDESEAARHDEERPAPPRRRIFLVPALLLLALLVWGAVGHWRTGSRAEATRRSTVEFVPEVRTARAERVTKPVDTTLPGQTEAFDAATILARATGYIAERRADIGTRVRRGDLLVRISAPDLDQQLAQAEAQLAQYQAALFQAQANVQQAAANSRLANVTKYRQTTLASAGWESRQNADNSTANSDVQRANVTSAVAGVRLAQANIAAQNATVGRLRALTSYERVTAPFDGVVTARNVDTGDLVTADQGGGTALFSLERIDVLRVAVYVPQSEAIAMHDGLPADIRVPEIPNRTFPGRVARSSVSLTQNARTLLVEVDVPNTDGALRSGLFADVTFHIPRERPGIVVPDEALVFDASGLHVLVVGQDGTVHAKPVAIFRDFGTSAELRDGLQGGEELVLSPPADLGEGGRVKVAKKG